MLQLTEETLNRRRVVGGTSPATRHVIRRLLAVPASAVASAVAAYLQPAGRAPEEEVCAVQPSSEVQPSTGNTKPPKARQARRKAGQARQPPVISELLYASENLKDQEKCRWLMSNFNIAHAPRKTDEL